MDTRHCPTNQSDNDANAAMLLALAPGAPSMHAIDMPSPLACRYSLLQYSWCIHSAKIRQCSIANYIHAIIYPKISQCSIANCIHAIIYPYHSTDTTMQLLSILCILLLLLK